MSRRADIGLAKPARARTRRLMLLLKLLASIIVIALLIRFVDVGQAFELVRRADVGLLAIGGAGLLGQTAISAAKWRLLLQAQGSPVGYPDLLRTYLIGDFVNLFMPGIVGGDAYRAAWLRRQTGTLGSALPSIIVDRLSGLAALLLIASIGLGALFVRDHMWIVGGAVLAALLGGYLMAIGPIDRWLAVRPRSRFQALWDSGRLITGQIKPSRTIVGVALLSMLFQLNTVLILWLYSIATHLSVGFEQLLLAVPTVSVLEMLPISVNGLGLREGAFSVLLSRMGVPATHGLALGLTVSIMRYVVGLVGGGLLVAQIGGHSREKRGSAFSPNTTE